MINKRQLIKSIVYRVYSSVFTFLVSYILTGNVILSLSIGIIDSLVKVFSYYAFDELWNRVTGFKTEPAVVFLTGLSGAGKTTIAKTLIEKLRKKGVTPVLLDGEAAITLHDMGMGAVCGIRSAARHRAAECFASYEQPSSQKPLFWQPTRL